MEFKDQVGVIVNKEAKYIIAHATGSVRELEATTLINQFRDTVTSMDTSDYCLIVDGSGAKPVSTEVTVHMGTVIGLYVNTPFKKRYMIDNGAGIKAKQIERVGGGDLEGFFVANSVEDAIANLNK